MKNFRKNVIASTIALLFMVMLCNAQQQPYQRFQYHKYKWQAFHTSTFHIYFLKGRDSLCAFLSREWTNAAALIKKRMNTGLRSVPNIIIYPSVTGLYESNAGASELQQVTLPTFLFKGTRMLLSYDGSYERLHDQLYEAIARSVWEEQINQGAEQQTNQRELIPYWYGEGAIRYFAHLWPVTAEDKLRRVFATKNHESWEQIIAGQPALAGQAFCYFLSGKYLYSTPSAIFFQLKKRKPLANALRLVTKRNINELFAECLQFYQLRFGATENITVISTNASSNRPVNLAHKKGTIREVISSPDEQSFVYVLAGWHKRTVYIYHPATAEKTKLLTYQLPPWIKDHNDDNYPLICYGANENEVLVALPAKDRIMVTRYSIDGKKFDQYPLQNIDGIGSLSMVDVRTLLLTAWRKGQSDIVQYSINKQQYTALTNDTADDAQPDLKDDVLLFVSKRSQPKQEKKSSNNNIKDSSVMAQGIYRLQAKKITPIATDTLSYVQYHQPQQLADGSLLYAGTSSGAERYYRLKGNSRTVLSSTLPMQYLRKTDRVVTWKSTNDSLFISTIPLEGWASANEFKDASEAPWLVDYRQRAAVRAAEDSILKAANNNNDSASFLSGILMPKQDIAKANVKRDSIESSFIYRPSKKDPYILQLHSAYFTAKLSNDYFINRYQPYEGYQGQFKFPETGGLAQGGFSDLFENHHFTIGYRLPSSSEGSDFFARYNNTARKLDWGVTYFRKVEQLQPDPKRYWVNAAGNPYPNLAKVKTNYYEISLHYPLTYFSALHFSIAARKDRTVFLATERYSLGFDPLESLWMPITLSYELNKLQPTVPLLYKGFKGKAELNVFKGFTGAEATLMGADIHAEWHKPLYKYITLVARASAGYSAGDQYLLYNFGGVDNNITPKSDTNVHFPQNAPYAFQTLVAPLRGYFQNSLYGSSYTLLNADVYFPLFTTLIPIETLLPSLNNLQPGLFMDMARAWQTFSTSPSSQSKWSYGLSARTKLAGYPLRVDVGWPGSFNKKPVWYLSLNLVH